jgi:hypothetical protein
MTSVAGHIVATDFDVRYKSWANHPPHALFEANIVTYIEDVGIHLLGCDQNS